MTAETALEFDEIRRQVAGLCRTGRGAAIIASQPIRTDPETVAILVDHVEAVFRLIENGVSPPSDEVADLSHLWNMRTIAGFRLDLEDLFEVKQLLEGASSLTKWCNHDQADEIVRHRAQSFSPPEDLLTTLRTYILPNGELNYDAVPELKTLRTQETAINARLHQTAKSIIQRSARMFRNSEPTIRDGRTVLALAANFKGQIDGIVHESSGSGNTVFVEPNDLVSLNNELVTLHNQRFRIIQQVLSDLTDQVMVEKDLLEQIELNYAEMDGTVARAVWAHRHRCVRPFVGEHILLKQARHPLLGETCIPLDVDFGQDAQLLVVSGPNTGGKTVLLKTVGLLSMMHQFGMLIPAKEGTILPVFDFFGVDIGDEQSIAESLSTFSAHLRNQAEILHHAGPESLVLIDELGAGSDPEEASSLALALIDELISRNSTVVVTTHQTVLKHYGYTNQRARNVSMEFDADRRRPTYRVIPDIPGSSFAIETAEAVGIPEPVLQKARSYRDENRSDVSQILSRLAEQERNLLEDRKHLKERTQELESELEAVRQERKATLDREQQLRREGIRELDELIRSSRKEIEATVRRIRNRGKKGKSVESEHIQAAHAAVDQANATREAQQTRVVELTGLRSDNTGTQGPAVREGMEVKHIRTGRTGTIVRTKGPHALVQFGAMRMEVETEELRAVKGGGDRHDRPSLDVSVSESSGNEAQLEIDVRGLRLHEALDRLDRQIDRAVVSGLQQFSIIHGTGTGVLQKGVREHLQSLPSVAGVDFASAETGGFGRSVVTLRSES